MGIEVLFELFKDRRTPEQKIFDRAKFEADQKRDNRIFLAKIFLASAGTIAAIGGVGYWLGSHNGQATQHELTLQDCVKRAPSGTLKVELETQRSGSTVCRFTP